MSMHKWSKTLILVGFVAGCGGADGTASAAGTGGSGGGSSGTGGIAGTGGLGAASSGGAGGVMGTGGSGGSSGGTGGIAGTGSSGGSGGASSSGTGGSGGLQPCAQGASPGVPSWTHASGSTGLQKGEGVAVDAAGNIYVTGSFKETVDFGGGPLTSAGDSVFVAKLDAAGNHLWSKSFGDAAGQAGTAIALDAAGNVVIAGSFNGTIDLGGGPLTSAAGSNVFLAKLDPAGGALLWSAGDSQGQTVTSMVIDAADNILLTGARAGGVMYSHCSFLAKRDAMGQPVWSKLMCGDAGPKDVRSRAVAVDGAGNVFVTGGYGGPPGGGYSAGDTIHFGNTSVHTPFSFAMFVVKYDLAGNDVWSKSVDAIEPVFHADAAADASGGLVLARLDGYLNGLFVSRLDGQGQELWSRELGAQAFPDKTSPVRIRADAAGHALVMAPFSYTVDIGLGPVTAPSGSVLVAGLDLCSGETLWNTGAGDAAWQAGLHMAIDGSSTIVVTGATNITGPYLYEADVLLTKLTY